VFQPCLWDNLNEGFWFGIRVDKDKFVFGVWEIGAEILVLYCRKYFGWKFKIIPSEYILPKCTLSAGFSMFILQFDERSFSSPALPFFLSLFFLENAICIYPLFVWFMMALYRRDILYFSLLRAKIFNRSVA